MTDKATSDLWWKNAVIYCADVATWLDSDGDTTACSGADAGYGALDCAVKTRYRQNDLGCTVRLHAGAPNISAAPIWRVSLSEPARAVTPGQYAVFYRGARCLGGGVIAQRFNFRTAHGARGITYNSLFSVEGS